ncbi:Methyltransferase-like protein 23 [Amphibalanus amphitrite]|uniref:Methyltransferase-like protein 23 n=1 Tax=Amphibalanus amphitrite TaxID=1232801 RepID=A0A6A4WV14_AMPAM|nr:methyltransferase-like protein 23 [Amphibalanus amphitrite]KAF0311326.1 Methyltransferase-like protein 23 [Amphibalanus amphitrite]
MDGLATASRYVRTFEFSSAGEAGAAVDEAPLVLRALVPEVLNRSYGLYTWPCAPVLAQYVFHERRRFAGAHVLELGAGTALPSIVAAKLGARVTVTDCAAAPQLLANCRRALELNAVRATVLGLSWGLVSPELLQLPPLQFILGSDVFYDEPLFEEVLRSVAFLLETSPHAEFVFSYQERSSERCLEPLLVKWRMQARQVPLAEFGADGPAVAGSDLPGNHSIQLYVVTLKQ